jgi:hypothetical protein
VIFMHRLFAFGLLCCFQVSACSGGGSASPFVQDGGEPTDAISEAARDAVGRDGPILGQTCLDDSQCDDGLDCTLDSCNRQLSRCQFVLDDSRCQNGVFCDGVEHCDGDLGCRQGAILDCNDDQTCTIDTCIEATKSCAHKLRDADGDGVPDGHCQANADCDDGDPTVYFGHVEVCANKKDDNCDGNVDEMPCEKPMHDSCIDPLLVTQTGVYELDSTAASFDYPGTCAPMDAATRKDVVVALQIVDAPRDADIVAEAPNGVVSVGIGKDCGVLTSEIACAKGLTGPGGSQVARFRAHSLGAGSYPVYVWTDRDQKILLHVKLAAPTPAPTNETCGTAAPIALGTPVLASLVGTQRDLASRCGFEVGDLVYRFELPAASDVTAYATSQDGYGVPVVSIRKDPCAAPTDEIACTYGSPATTFARALPKGVYYVAVSANGPTDFQLVVDATAPTTAPANETCVGSPLLAPNRTIDVSLAGHTDDIDLGCAPIASVDAAYDLELATSSDVLLVERIAQDDTGAVALATASCGGPSARKACGTGGSSPVRTSIRGVPAGSYRVVVETALANPIELTAFVRPEVPPTLVPFADTCASATAIAETGGFYQGNTSNAAADYSAGCDVAGVPPGGAPDQMLKFTLPVKKRVVFDMQGSSYPTMLDVRRGSVCPGVEMPGSCSVGYLALRSYLDLTLDPGIYWVQVDGYASSAGTWFLDVRVVDPQ